MQESVKAQHGSGQYNPRARPLPKEFHVWHSMAWQRDGGSVPHSCPVLLSDPGHMAGVPCLAVSLLDHPMDTGFKVWSQVSPEMDFASIDFPG